MALTMKLFQNLRMGLVLAVLASGAVASAQINPATPKNAAQAAAKVAGQSGGQSANQPGKPTGKTATPANSSKQSAAAQAKPAGQTKPLAQPTKPVSKTTATTNPAAQKNKKPVTKSAAGNPAATKPAPIKQTGAKTGSASTKHSATKPAPAKTPVKPAVKTDTAQEEKRTPPVSRRDPFVSLIGKQSGGGQGTAVKLPPGKAGLQVSTLMLQGIVSGPNGMIAVVANPQKGVYFLREGDSLFDGSVEHIKMDAVTFHEVGKDAFGKPLEREVTKRLNTSSGEQP